MVAVIALAAFLVGFSKAGVAGTLGPSVTVMVALALPADDAVGLLLPIMIIADWSTVAAHWKRWETPIYRRLLLAALIGIAIGSVVLSSIDEEMLRSIIAVAMLAYALLYAASRSIRLDPERIERYAWPAGVTSGLASTFAHLGGPPVFVYLMSTSLPPRRFVATGAILFATVNLLKVPAFFYAEMFNAELIASTLWTWLLIPVGVIAGRGVVERLNRLWFERITVAFLAIGAVVLLVV
ncbi:MAG: sulfite exporter TauE/SafE family protein [Acidimicrobiia bacterium]|nr:sulfite exporter TauE/SafE family protein [Acidimicrobiia bacterium]